jgi:hypothetical protein
MSVDFGSLHSILKHPIRQKIMLTLLEKNELAYVDLMNLVQVKNTGKLNYHLKILGDLIEKGGNGRYCLTEKGQLASQFLLRFPEKESERTALHFGDAVLIGFLGFVLTLANPGFWGFLSVSILGMGMVSILGLVLLVYALIVPGGLMWWLTVRRSHSHDSYDLFKPPFITFLLIVLLLISMALVGLRFTITFTSRLTDASYTMGQANLSVLLFFGLLFSFFGVGISELVHKAFEKVRS